MTDNLSTYGKLNATRAELMKLKDTHPIKGVRTRAAILIQNIDGLKKAPDDKALLEQFAKNTADLERFKSQNERR